MPSIESIFFYAGLSCSYLIAIGGVAYFIYRRIIRPVHRLVVAIDAVIERELKPNHGSSLYDAITRVEGKLDAHLQVALEETKELNKLSHEYEERHEDKPNA